jgi:hypothetical protein
VGSVKAYVYGPEGYEHTDYGDLIPGGNWGGEIGGEDYCDECYGAACGAGDD